MAYSSLSITLSALLQLLGDTPGEGKEVTSFGLEWEELTLNLKCWGDTGCGEEASLLMACATLSCLSDKVDVMMAMFADGHNENSIRCAFGFSLRSIYLWITTMLLKIN